MPDVLWLVVAAVLIGGGWLAFEFVRAPLMPAPPTFDDHAATACAALDSDAPLNTLSDHWLAYVDSLPVTHEREYR